MNNNMCPAPWINRMVHSSGQTTPCCYTKEQDIDYLKSEFLKGNKPVECQFCWYHEDNKLHSPRSDFINFFKESNKLSIEMLSLNLGSYCNAECITCNGGTSSSRNTWAKKYAPIEFIQSAILDSNLQLDFSKYIDLKMVTLIGGEPLIHPSTKSILLKMIDAGVAKNITVSFNTNASVYNQEIIDLLYQFKSIMVTLSIDGVGDYFEYQRRPLKWQIIKDNSIKWMNISENIIINYVVSAISIWGFNDFIHWYNNLPLQILNKNPQVIFVHVADKQYLTLNVLSDQQKKEWIATAADHQFASSIVNILNTTSFNQQLMLQFFKQMTLEDSTSKIKFADLFPTWQI